MIEDEGVAPSTTINIKAALGRLLDGLTSIDATHSKQAPDLLTAAAIVYLGLPNIVFLVGWLKPVFGIPLTLLVAVALWQLLRRPDWQWKQPYTIAALLTITVVGFLWASLGGAGHFFTTNPDWMVRDTVLADLTLTPWPPAYSDDGGAAHILRSAFGFFLVPAAISKWIGFQWIDIAAYVWAAAGSTLFLLLLPLPHKAGGKLGLGLLIALFFSGMDFLGIVLLTGITPIFPLRLEWWVPFSYSSLTGQLHWAPNHAIPLWLISTLFYRHWGHRFIPVLSVVLLPLLMVWTPFAVAGVLPFMAIAVVRWFAQGNGNPFAELKASQIATALVLTYLMLRFLTLGVAAMGAGAPTVSVAPNNDDFVLKYLLFVLMEFAILGLLLARSLKHSLGIFWLAFAILLLLPLYQFGPSNDTMLRLSTPCLVILLIITLDQASTWATPFSRAFFKSEAWLIVLVLLIGACTPFNEMWRAATFRRNLPNYGMSLVEQQNGFEPPHYIGHLNKRDLVVLLNRPSRVPTLDVRKAQGLVPVPVWERPR